MVITTGISVGRAAGKQQWAIWQEDLGHRLYCNAGGNLSRNRCIGFLSSAALKEALGQLNPPGKQADPSSYASVLKSLGIAKALQEGKCIHDLIIVRGLDRDMFIVSHLVQMYGTCGDLDDAFALFVNMHDRNVFSWNFMIRACARRGENEKVHSLLKQMQQEGVIPTKVTFVSVFDACAGHMTLDVGHQMHALIVDSPFEVDVIVGTALVNMYGKFGSVEGASYCFDKMREQDVIAWTALISAFSQYAQGKEAFHLFDQMLQEGAMPNEVTFISLCDACANYSSLLEGKQMHARICNGGLEANVVVENALIDMYGKCGCLENAKTVFKKMGERNLVSWTAMISAYSQHGHYKEALQHFFHMQQLGILPDNVAFTTILAASAGLALLADCKLMHAIILIREPEIDVVIGTALVNTYGKCGDVVSAKSTFDEMVDRNVFSWNAVIAAFTQNGHSKEAYSLFDQMREEGTLPNKVTFVSIIDACASSQAALRRGAQMHACTLQCELDVENALIHMYGKCGRLESAQCIFDDMLERDLITWNAMITVHAQHGQRKKALGYFDRMWQEGVQPDEATFVSILSACVSGEALAKGQQIHAFILDGGFECNVVVVTALVSMYGRCDSLEDARMVFDGMGNRNEVSWNAMIAIYEQAGQAEAALELFDRMQHDNVSPDYVTFVTVLSACITQSALVEGKIVHAHILESGCSADVVLNTSIINMYGKSGSLEDARRMFDKMQERSVVSWNTMIAVYAQHGLAVGALGVFSQMQADGVMPNKVTFVNILGACSHSGFFAEAHQYFKSMMENHSISLAVDHFVCLVDLFGRAGRLDEAEDIMNGMPVQPSAVSFMAMLGACRYRDDVERGERAAKHASELEPANRAPHLVLSNIYAAVGRVDDAVEVMSLFEDGMKQTACIIDEVQLDNFYE